MSSARVNESSLWQRCIRAKVKPRKWAGRKKNIKVKSRTSEFEKVQPVSHIVLLNVSILKPSSVLRVGEEPLIILEKRGFIKMGGLTLNIRPGAKGPPTCLDCTLPSLEVEFG